MNYGICSNGSRDTGFETAIKIAKIISDLGFQKKIDWLDGKMIK